jgi:N-acetylneuraminic acid mutarotase
MPTVIILRQTNGLQEFEIPAARRRGAAAAVEFNGRFYVIGGITNGHMNSAVA